MHKYNYFIFGLVLILQSCTISAQSETPSEIESKKYKEFSKAYFASGCFWCVEAIYESVKGVKEVYSGYSGGFTKNPTYASSNTGKTGHAESVMVIYDSSKINFKTLVDIYFGSQNISQVNGQGPDIGSQYRSIIFYKDLEEKRIINNKIEKIKSEGIKVAAEVMQFEKFWFAEEYHQDYKKKNPNNSYIKAISNPRFNRFKNKFPDLIKDK
ncbi:peptide-methionine (S)-S-oxide reductase MsrA [Psychroflexus sp. ALD_RP9]|uniref:peptide-methionine (S)-S-oxide reductase MsrA n=1 Tax=Psychroflexus sp. ALD_RP9 TaxID=2777186 RepID=UPI001A8F2EAF|nr:peptide-methionine (S)-S-oxide reductase MsrA [Psychroflexus sp. ALD_RP9]QSS96958.1 peptide-methionine (S)-S-oxide reductase MsrA [Psychroflexus sp. ALD_RP9]